MPIITPVEAKSRRVKVLYALIYLVLTIGAISMVYPMMIMLSGAVKSDSDIADMDAIPKFIYDPNTFYRKFLEAKYNGETEHLKSSYHKTYRSWRTIVVPGHFEDENLLARYNEFSAGDWPGQWQYLAHTAIQGTKLLQFNHRGYVKKLQGHFDGSIEALNAAMNTVYNSWREVPPPLLGADLGSATQIGGRRYWPADSIADSIAREFVLERPKHQRYFVDLDGYFINNYLIPTYGEAPNLDFRDPCQPHYNPEEPDKKNYNELHDTNYASYEEALLTTRIPEQKVRRADWMQFVLSELNLAFIRIDPSEQEQYQEFLKQAYGNDISFVNKFYGTDYGSFGEVVMPTTVPTHSLQRSDWETFLTNATEPEKPSPAFAAIEVYGPRQAFEEFLREKGYPVDAAKTSLLAKAVRDADLADFRAHRSFYFWEFLRRNFIMVIQQILIHGRSVWNTAVLCTLMIIANLLVNPLAAYAMSRYKLPSTYKILLFAMATMAFPPMVTAIPSFLLIRDLGLINSYAALILPAMANGYWIFLLKGFFDSLPQELYEAANLDGASEWRMFWMITMSLSKPVLAVIALQAFTGMYNTFMYALLVIPDPEMWTLMVWIYQMAQTVHQSVIYAGLIIIAIPPFLIFVLCQNVIMRGIVVPVEK